MAWIAYRSSQIGKNVFLADWLGREHNSRMRPDDHIAYFAETNYRNKERRFGIRRRDRRSHVYVVGKTGTGKSTLLRTLALQDLQRGDGFALLDPHGDLVEQVLAAVPMEGSKKVIYFNVPNSGRPIHFNPLAKVPYAKRALVTSGLMDVFKKLWSDSWGVRLEHLLRNTFLALLDQPYASFPDILRFLDDSRFRSEAIPRIVNPQVRRFWQQEYSQLPYRYRVEAAAPIQNKVGAFLANPTLREILGSPKSDIDLREIMDHGSILLVNLAKGKLGEEAAALLGSLLVSQIGFIGLSRADIPEETRRDFYVYLDEFQTFTTLSLATMLSELRKYRVSLVLANQYLSQIETEVFDAVMGNAGTIVTFRVGPRDAEFLAKYFAPEFKALDLMDLPNHHVYVRLMIDGAVSVPFSAVTVV